MSPRSMVTGLLAVAIVALSATARSEQAGPDYLFVQTATNGTLRDGLLTLSGIGPMTVYFSDRPDRQVGYLTQAEFLEAWTGAADSFASDPPNASITFRVGERGFLAVMELMEPVLIDDGIRYRVKLLKGDPPADLGPASLFIDAGGLMQLVAYGSQGVNLGTKR